MAEITITHTHEDGTLLHGSSKGDGVLEIVRLYGFKWGPTVGIYMRGSRDKDAHASRINGAAEALRAAGHTVTVEIDNAWRSAEVRRADAAERAENRADRLDERADKASAEAVAHRDAARQIGDGIPFGQPILVGHHSEGKHRRDLARMENHDRKRYEAGQKADRLAARADGARSNAEHRENPRAIMRRIDKLTADVRGHERALNGYERPSYNGRGEVVYVDKYEPATGERADMLRRYIDRDNEEIEFLRRRLADLEESGEFVAWGPEHFVKGDKVRITGRWHTVRRVNRKSVSVPWIVGGMVTGQESEHSDTVPWDSITGRRRDGWQLDTPNGEPWPVELADKVARWGGLLHAAQFEHQHPYDSPERRAAWHVGHAQRLVHGLDLDAADAQVKAITDSITGRDERRELAAAYLAVYDRLAAGESVSAIRESLTPITGDPAWTLPTDVEPERVRVDHVRPGELVGGVWDAGDSKPQRSFCGPVKHVSPVLNRREAGEFVTITLTTGQSHEFKTHRWLAVYRATPEDTTPTDQTEPDAPAADPVKVQPSDVTDAAAPAALFRAEAAKSWPNRPTVISGTVVHRTLLERGGPLAMEAATYAEVKGTTTWAQVHYNLMFHANVIQGVATRRHVGECLVCDTYSTVAAEPEQADPPATDEAAAMLTFDELFAAAGF